MELLRLDLPVPDYSTLSRRQTSLNPTLPISSGSRPRHVVLDATGLTVYGEGEWHVRKHRGGRHRAWPKLHLGVDETTKEIVAVEVTASPVHDSRMLPTMLAQVPSRIGPVSGDGAYDTRACYSVCSQSGGCGLSTHFHKYGNLCWERDGAQIEARRRLASPIRKPYRIYEREYLEFLNRVHITGSRRGQ